MDVEFADDELRRLETDAKFAAGFEAAIVKGFRKRLQVIRAAVDERDLYALKGNRFERLKGDRSRQCSLAVTGNWRLIVEIIGESPSTKKVRVIEIVDYH